MATYELVYLLFADGVQILKFVQRREFLHVQPVRRDDVRLTFEQVLGLEAGDVRDRGEHVRQVRRCAFHAVSVIDLSLARFFIDTEL